MVENLGVAPVVLLVAGSRVGAVLVVVVMMLVLGCVGDHN